MEKVPDGQMVSMPSSLRTVTSSNLERKASSLSTTSDPTVVPFSAQVRHATTASHEGAESAPFMRRLLEGELPLEGYGRLIAQHRAIYAALEGAHGSVVADETVAGFVQPEVVRLPALERDLVAVLGPGWADRPEAELVPATVEYCDRLDEVGRTWPAGWVGHQYVRYLGDLSGGLFIRRVIERTYGIDASSGTAFYDFPQVPDPAAWKDAYRARLDDAPWTDDERSRIIDEVLASYRWNTALLAQLDG